jgi:hypothetical protein
MVIDMRKVLNRVAGPGVRTILTSPMHGLLSKKLALLTVTDRAAGRQFTCPVQYVRRDGDIYLFTLPTRRWWRHLEGGAPIAVVLQGQSLQGHGEVYSPADPNAVPAIFAGSSLVNAVASAPDGVIVRLSELRPAAPEPVRIGS